MNPWSFFFIGYVFFTAPHIFLIILLLTRSVCITDYLKIWLYVNSWGGIS